jgi:hypothetical protein
MILFGSLVRKEHCNARPYPFYPAVPFFYPLTHSFHLLVPPSSFVIAALRLLDSLLVRSFCFSIASTTRLVACSDPSSLTSSSTIVKRLQFNCVFGKLRSAMSYKVEELLALRDSISESAVSIDKFADENVIKGW